MRTPPLDHPTRRFHRLSTRGSGSAFLRAGVVALVAFGPGGCVTMGGSVGEMVGLSAPLASKRMTLFVASTRPEKPAVAGAAQPGAARASTLVLTVPPGHTPGVIERPSITPESARRHFTIESRRPVEGGSLTAAVTDQLAGRTGIGQDVLVYVHGFNTSLQDAAFRVGQIATDTGFTGAPVVFTWPAGSSLLGYGSDREQATSSRDALERLLVDLGSAPGVGRVHVIAHSMGSWLAMEALRQAAIGGRGDLNGRLGQVMLAHPDLDLEVFKGQLARIGRTDNISLFLASDDRALQMSGRLAGRGRLGALDLEDERVRGEITGLGVRVYDLTGSGQDRVRHSTFAEAPDVVKLIGGRLSEPRVQEAAPTAVESAPLDAPRVAGVGGATGAAQP